MAIIAGGGAVRECAPVNANPPVKESDGLGARFSGGPEVVVAVALCAGGRRIKPLHSMHGRTRVGVVTLFRSPVCGKARSWR